MTAFVIILICLAIIRAQILLAMVSAFAGLLFLTIVRSGSTLVVDERDQSIREKAAQLTYMIFAPTLGWLITILSPILLTGFYFLITIYLYQYYVHKHQYRFRTDMELQTMLADFHWIGSKTISGNWILPIGCQTK